MHSYMPAGLKGQWVTLHLPRRPVSGRVTEIGTKEVAIDPERPYASTLVVDWTKVEAYEVWASDPGRTTKCSP